MRRLLGPVLLWVGAVAVVAGATWLVVDRAGRGVGAEVVAPSLPVSGTSTTPRSAGTGTGSPSRTRSLPTSPAATATSRAPSSPGAPSSPTAADGARTASFTVVGGTVTATCDGPTPRLVSAIPRDGYAPEVEARSDRLEVRFEGEGSGSSDETRVRVVCVAGVPTRDG